MKLRLPRMRTLVITSAVLTLAALALMVWSIAQPTPLPVMLAMSLGQALGTTAFVLYLIAIVLDLRRAHREEDP